jgi:hypothetical protein
MSSKERRISPRKACTIPVRFRFRASVNELVPASLGIAASCGASREVRMVKQRPSNQEAIVGETVNLSERGTRFKSPCRFRVGESVQMYFTLPWELAGRNPEEIRYKARLVRVEKESDAQGMTDIGVAVERFEPPNYRRNWSN